jgi:hypothetical protein
VIARNVYTVHTTLSNRVDSVHILAER